MKFLKSKSYSILALIFLLGFILRIYGLGNMPISVDKDEALLGYNAYSILKTGMDISGNMYPLHLESFLYTPAGYSYLSIIPIYLFDLNPLSIRLASSILGSFSIIVFYFLIRTALQSYRMFDGSKSSRIALIASFILSISPWHIILSRTASVSVVIFFIIILAAFLLIYSLSKKNNYLLFVSYLLFFISLFFYIASYSVVILLIPLILLTIPIKLNKKILIKHILLFLIFIIIPVFLTFNSNTLSTRASMLSIFSSPEGTLLTQELINHDGIEGNNILVTRIFHNKVISYIYLYLDNFFKHLSFEFLFTSNYFPARYVIPMHGLLYLVDLLFVFIGLVVLMKNNKRFLLLILGWIVVAIYGSSLAYHDIPNMQRSILLLVPLVTICSLGISLAFDKTPKKFKKLFIVLLTVIYIIFFIYFIHQYFVHNKYYRTFYRNEGYEKLFEYLNTLGSNKIIITDREENPAVFMLFYKKIDPRKFLENNTYRSKPDYEKLKIDNVQFMKTECVSGIMFKNNLRMENKSTIFVDAAGCNGNKFVTPIKSIYRNDGTEVFRIYKSL